MIGDIVHPVDDIEAPQGGREVAHVSVLKADRSFWSVLAAGYMEHGDGYVTAGHLEASVEKDEATSAGSAPDVEESVSVRPVLSDGIEDEVSPDLVVVSGFPPVI
jgi:hypothetical protein